MRQAKYRMKQNAGGFGVYRQEEVNGQWKDVKHIQTFDKKEDAEWRVRMFGLATVVRGEYRGVARA